MNEIKKLQKVFIRESESEMRITRTMFQEVSEPLQFLPLLQTPFLFVRKFLDRITKYAFYEY